VYTLSQSEIEVFNIFPWDKNFETGIAIIDEQHQQLVHILNQLAAHLANRSTPLTLNKIFNELADYADYHFKTEEKIWTTHFKDDDWYTSHEKTHQSFTNKIKTLKDNEISKPLDDVIHDVVSYLSHWLAYHILDTDKRMAKVVLALESGDSLEQAKNHANEEMSGSMKVLIDTVLTMYDSLSGRTLDLMREKALRKQAENALLESEERWKFILEGSGENVWDWDIEHGEKNYSETESPIFNLIFNDPEHKSKIHPADIKRVKADIQAHLDGKTEFYINKHRVLRKNGSWSWISTRGKVVSRNENGTALRMIGTHSDVTEHELASLIYQHSNQALLVTDVNNEIISINPAFTEITGYSEKDSIGKNPSFRASDKHDKTFFKQMWDEINNSGYWRGEIWNKRKNGEIYPELLSINTVKDSSGIVDHYISLFTDISERKKAEDALRRVQKMDAIGQLTGGISHDFNNLLAIILGNLELLEMQISADSDAYQKIKSIQKAGKRAANLTKQLLNFSRNQPEQTTATDINQVISEMESLINRSVTPEVEVNYDFSEDLWLTEIDPGDFEDALLNLVINARDAMKGHGQLTLKTNNSTFDIADCELNPDITPGQYVQLTVIDSGEGISLNQQEHVFEPFYTTKEQDKGTGLGLAMVYSFVKRSKGYIKIYSELGIGTTFKIYLPQTKDIENSSSQKSDHKKSLPLGTETLLLVDDEPALLELAREFLCAQGYRVLTAENSYQALECLKKEPAIELLFSDIVMPGGVNGYELAKMVTNTYPNLKVLLTSGYPGKALTSDVGLNIDTNLLKKPYSNDELIKRVRETLNKDNISDDDKT